MAIRVACTCGQVVEAGDEQMGQQVACPACRTMLTVQPPPAEPVVLLEYARQPIRRVGGLRPADWVAIVVIGSVCLFLACAIVMPALSRTHCGIQVSCGSNLRQVTYAALAYANDWKDQLPTAVGVPDHASVGLAYRGRLPIIGFDTVSIWDWGSYLNSNDGMSFLGGWAFMMRDYLKNDFDIVVCPDGYAKREDILVRWDGSQAGSYLCTLNDYTAKVGYLWLPHRNPGPSAVIGNCCNDGGPGVRASDKPSEVARTASDNPALLVSADWNQFGSRYYAGCGVAAHTGCGLLANHLPIDWAKSRSWPLESGCMPQVFPPKIGKKEDPSLMPMGMNKSRIDARTTWVAFPDWDYFKWGITHNPKDGRWHAW